MFPKRLRQEPRILGLTLVITFISGANFFAILMFWPTQAFNVYGHDPIGVGLRGLPIGFAILAGAVIVLMLLSVLRGHNKELLIASSVLMTAGVGSLAVARVDNLYQLWGLLVLAGIGIGGMPLRALRDDHSYTSLIVNTGIVVPASIICKSSSMREKSLFGKIVPDHLNSNDHLPRRPHRHRRRLDPRHPRHRRLHRLLRIVRPLP